MSDTSKKNQRTSMVWNYFIGNVRYSRRVLEYSLRYSPSTRVEITRIAQPYLGAPRNAEKLRLEPTPEQLWTTARPLAGCSEQPVRQQQRHCRRWWNVGCDDQEVPRSSQREVAALVRCLCDVKPRVAFPPAVHQTT